MSALVATRGNQIIPILSYVEARQLSIPRPAQPGKPDV